MNYLENLIELYEKFNMEYARFQNEDGSQGIRVSNQDHHDLQEKALKLGSPKKNYTEIIINARGTFMTQSDEGKP